MVRIKNRWLLVELLPTATTLGSTTAPALDPVPSARVWKSSTIFHAIKQSVILNFGDAGWGAVGVSLSVKYYSPTTQTCIIKVGREHVRIARGAITLLTNIDGIGVLPIVSRCSGTIRGLQIASIEHNRAVIARCRARVAEDREAGRSGLQGIIYPSYLDASTQELESHRVHDVMTDQIERTERM